ncbi:hypothetical protein ACIBCM_29955 [Streptomyces sp. NPDC051018]|uniref:hypothetical protein n=1 Tax=Streptomyces sp. NPDC051018 TaxID=3365639 RepID=UPI0037BA35C9
MRKRPAALVPAAAAAMVLTSAPSAQALEFFTPLRLVYSKGYVNAEVRSEGRVIRFNGGTNENDVRGFCSRVRFTALNDRLEPIVDRHPDAVLVTTTSWHCVKGGKPFAAGLSTPSVPGGATVVRVDVETKPTATSPDPGVATASQLCVRGSICR